ncbi:CPBP family intramembrane metalloprotease, partial [bacterium]|nr:CPBP family intramembrane metalloprotease [bacterium]
LGGALLGAGILVPIQHALMALQQRALPMPDSFAEELAGSLGELSGFAAILLFAVSPGICEELVFRGAFLGLLRRVGSVRSAVLISAAFFGLIHLSVFRFLPTFTVGVVAAIVVVRSGSIFPAMLLHACYNGIAVGQEDLPGWAQGLLESSAAGWAASLAALAAGAWLLRARAADADGDPVPGGSVSPRR